MKVLVVDDDPVIRALISKLVKVHGHEPIAADNGEAAWASFQDESVPLVITDWNMPGCNGEELVRRIRAHAAQEYTYIIMLTGSFGAEEKTAFKAGVDDFLLKPVVPADIAARLRVASRISSMQHALAVAHASVQRDLQAAARLQRSLLPASIPTDCLLDAAWRFKPCAGIGGDFLNCFRLDEHHVAFFLFDVVGHGIAAALLAVQVHRQMSPLMSASTLLKRPIAVEPFYEVVPPEQVMLGLAEQFRSAAGRMDAFTICYGLWDIRSRRIHLANAGHPTILIKRGSTVECLDLPSRPIGLFSPQDTEPASLCLRLAPGDAIIIASDGLTECMNAQGEELGNEGLAAALALETASADQIADAAIRASDAISNNAPSVDDRTVLVLRALPN